VQPSYIRNQLRKAIAIRKLSHSITPTLLGGAKINLNQATLAPYLDNFLFRRSSIDFWNILILGIFH
jgi:hypothetical protein